MPAVTVNQHARAEPHARRTMDRGNNARAKELNNLRLALATFAVQLDAFELRTSRRPLGTGAGSDALVPRADIGRGPAGGKNDWLSIKSPGNKLDG
jgi:hypothetical protein